MVNEWPASLCANGSTMVIQWLATLDNGSEWKILFKAALTISHLSINHQLWRFPADFPTQPSPTSHWSLTHSCLKQRLPESNLLGAPTFKHVDVNLFSVIRFEITRPPSSCAGECPTWWVYQHIHRQHPSTIIMAGGSFWGPRIIQVYSPVKNRLAKNHQKFDG